MTFDPVLLLPDQLYMMNITKTNKLYVFTILAQDLQMDTIPCPHNVGEIKYIRGVYQKW